MSLKLPSTVAVELQYRYLENPVVYVFPRLQKRDADIDERERVLGNGQRMKSSLRLSLLVDNIMGFENLGLQPRGTRLIDVEVTHFEEPEHEYRQRVAQFFSSDDGEELAEHALIYRVAAATPQSTFRGGQNSGLAEHLRGQEAGRPVPSLPNVRTTTPGPAQGMPVVPFDTGPKDPQATDPGGGN